MISVTVEPKTRSENVKNKIKKELKGSMNSSMEEKNRKNTRINHENFDYEQDDPSPSSGGIGIEKQTDLGEKQTDLGENQTDLGAENLDVLADTAGHNMVDHQRENGAKNSSEQTVHRSLKFHITKKIHHEKDRASFQKQESSDLAKSDHTTTTTTLKNNSVSFHSSALPSPVFDADKNNELICSHLYNNAYLNGLYSDLVVRISYQGSMQSSPNNIDGFTFKLHRIMAIRSSVLARMIKEASASNGSSEYTSSPLSLQLVVKDPYLTRAGLGIAFGHLYASYSSLLLQSNHTRDTDGEKNDTEITQERTLLLRSVLAAARLLDLPDLSHQCIENMKALIKMDSVTELAKFLSNDSGVIMTPTLQDLKDAVFTYLCKGFILDVLENKGIIWGNPQAKGYLYAVQTFAQLPFEWVKGVLESSYFDVPSEMERFNFAKSVIVHRSSKSKSNDQGKNSMIAGTENVLLSFGAKKKGTGVTIVRKMEHNGHGIGSGSDRRLWKASIH